MFFISNQNSQECTYFNGKKLILFSLLLLIICKNINAQKQVKVYNQKIENGYEIFVNNEDPYPVSITIDYKLTNLKSNINTEFIVIPAQAKQFSVDKILIEKENEAYKFSYKYHTYLGDLNAKPDEDFVYELPFAKSEKYKLFQGYNGDFSHQNENALDFTMPIGTRILAARDGIVIQVVDNNNKTCNNRSCMEYNNFITILHSDGTYAKYVHIDFEGAKVNIGDKVSTGQIIALSGNIGFSSGPHLHFEVCKPSTQNKFTLQTKFKVDDGSKISLLQEGNIYIKNY